MTERTPEQAIKQIVDRDLAILVSFRHGEGVDEATCMEALRKALSGGEDLLSQDIRAAILQEANTSCSD